MNNTVEISILNQKFFLKKGETSEDYIRSLAGYVDGKMREIQGKAKSVSTANVAILAALNIADERFKANDGLNAIGGKLKESVKDIIQLISAELEAS